MGCLLGCLGISIFWGWFFLGSFICASLFHKLGLNLPFYLGIIIHLLVLAFIMAVLAFFGCGDVRGVGGWRHAAKSFYVGICAAILGFCIAGIPALILWDNPKFPYWLFIIFVPAFMFSFYKIFGVIGSSPEEIDGHSGYETEGSGYVNFDQGLASILFGDKNVKKSQLKKLILFSMIIAGILLSISNPIYFILLIVIAIIIEVLRNLGLFNKKKS